MATYYIRSTDGSDADSGFTWALAKAASASPFALDVAGDTFYYSQVHNEIGAGVAIGFACAGSLSNPNKLVCVNDAAEPPTTLATGAAFTTTGAFGIQFLGNFYAYGLTFNAGDGANAATINFVSATATTEAQVFDNCVFNLPNTSATSSLLIGHMTGSVSHKCTWKNSQVKFGHASQRITVAVADFIWKGGSAQSGTTTPTTGLILNAGTGRAGNALVEGVDLSNFSSSLALVAAAGLPGRIVYRNCKLPASWGGALFNAAPTVFGLRAEMYNCDSGDTNHRLHIEDAAGSIKSNTTVYRTGGASDGTTPLSWRMVATANATYLAHPLESGEIVKWNEVVGTEITATIETLTDNVTLTDGTCWIEVQYLGTTGFPLSSFISDAKATVLSTAVAQTPSTEAWTTTGITTPVKQKLSVTFTPQEKGFIHAKVFTTSGTVYIDPVLTVV